MREVIGRSTYVSRPTAIRGKSIRKCKQLTGTMWKRSVSSRSMLLVLIVLSLTGEGMNDTLDYNRPND